MKKVFIYALSTCPWCRKAKMFFQEHQIAFDFVDYDLAKGKDQERLMKEIKDLGGNNSFPLVKIDEDVVIGYNPEMFIKLLGIK